jgi:hypothetical protein
VFYNEESQKTEEELLSKEKLSKQEKEKRRGEIWLDKIYNARLYFEPYRYQAFIANKKYMSENFEFDMARIFFGEHDHDISSDMREISSRMNLFYTTIKTQRACILPELPRVIIRKHDLKEFYQNEDKTKFYNIVQQVITSILKYYTSPDVFDPRVFELFKLDYFVTGMGTLWVNHHFRTSERQKFNQNITVDHVKWYDFAMDIKFEWNDVQWVARRKFFNRSSFRLNFPDVDMKKMSFYDYAQMLESPWQDRDFYMFQDFMERSGDKWVSIWEIWDKEKCRCLFVSDSYEDKLLKQTQLSLKPEHVFPCPPLAEHIPSTFDLMPRSEMWSYYHELDELSKIS